MSEQLKKYQGWIESLRKKKSPDLLSEAAKLMGKRGGASSSPAKVEAAKENGKKGGAPKG
jgi:hypothetical protein